MIRSSGRVPARLSCAVLAVLALTVVHADQRGTPPPPYDLVVYGGTAGGVITAVAAAREGLRVVLVEPGRHLGGMVSGGLGWTDYGRKEVIGGYSLEFFERVGAKYGRPIEWHFEPHVAEAVFNDLVKEAGVRVILEQRLREKGGVRKAGTRVSEIVMESGATFSARLFADATYEGDLMAQAGVSYTWGREGISEYNESLAGVRDRTPLHQFRAAVSPYNASGRLLPEIMPRSKDPVGAADKRVQAYNFRLCMTKASDNRVSWPKPAGYSSARYELLARYLPAFEKELGRPLAINDVMKADILQNGKTDTNNNGAFSTDYIGGSYGYPEGSYATRARIRQAHVELHPGLPVLPRDRHPRARGPLGRDEGVGPVPRRVCGHRSLALSAVRPRSAADGWRVRDVAEGYPDGADQAGRHRHGVL